MARAALAELEIEIDPRALVRDLPFSQQQLIEIAKALSFGGRVLILDEPTSALTEHESAILFRRLERLRAAGMGDHLCQPSAARGVRAQRSHHHPARRTPDWNLRDEDLYAGRSHKHDGQPQRRQRRAPGHDRDRCRRGSSCAASASARLSRMSISNCVSGEILGLAGLAGAGQSEIGRALGGLVPRRARSITLDGSPFRCRTPGQAMRAGVVYLPADRRVEGLFLGLTVEQNVVASSLDKLSGALWMKDAEARELAAGFVESAQRPHPFAPPARGEPQRRQPAKSGARARSDVQTRASSSPTSRRAASTSAPRRRSTVCCASSRTQARAYC